VKALAYFPKGWTGLRGCLVSGLSRPIKRTLHSTHTEGKTERHIIIDASMIRQMKLLEVPDCLIDVTPEPRELPERFRGLVGGDLREGEDE
jgi:hypothetical protein